FRSYPQGREAGRSADPGSNKVRAGDQSQNREDAGPQRAADIASKRRRGNRMKRREFITLVGGAAAAWPLAARAQQPPVPVIGFLGASSRFNWAGWTAAFVEGLRDLGWIEGRTVKIDYRWAEGQSQRYAEIAAEFARLKVDVIVTVGSAVPAAKQATATIPIVFALAVEPVT